METKFEKNAKVFKALSDSNRLMIFEILQNGEKCACKILEALKISQPTLSHHLKILCDSGLVKFRREGKWMHYSIDELGSTKAKKLLDEITTLVESNELIGS